MTVKGLRGLDVRTLVLAGLSFSAGALSSG